MINTIRFKDLFKIVSRKNTNPKVMLLAATQDRGIIPKSEVGYRTVTISEENFDGLKLVKKGDFCITLRSFQGGIEYSEYNGGISSGYTVLRFKIKALDRYFKYFLKNVDFISTLNKYKVSIRDGQNIPFSSLGKEQVLFLPLSKQIEIANYLDIQTSKIDKTLSLLEQKVQKLEEYRQSLIFETVTKGLDKDVKLKDSGIDWIGQIPEDWQVNNLKKYLLKTVSGGTPSANDSSLYDENGTPWVTIGDITNRSYIENTKNKVSNKGISDKNLKIIPYGTLLYSMYASVGYSAELLLNATINQSILALFIKKELNQRFLKYSLDGFRLWILRDAIGTTQINLNADKVKNIKILIPHIKIQQEIANYLDLQTSKIDKKKEVIKKKMELLKEYKQSLIFEVVTGKREIESESE